MLQAMLTTVAALFLTLAATQAVADDAGKVVSMEGTVEIGRGGAFTPAVTGSTVETGDTIRTGEPGRARILFIDDSVLNLGDNTTLRVDETVFDAGKGAASTLLHLLGGKVRALVSEYYTGGQGTYSIETTTAVSGVRGTEFVMTFDARTEFSEVLGIGGTVAVHSTMDRVRRGVLIHANELTEVAKGQFPTAPRQIASDDDRYGQLMEGLDLPGGGRPETLLLEDPAFGGVSVPGPDTATGNITIPTGGGTVGGAVDGGNGTGIEPNTDLPPSEPGHTGSDLLGQPPAVLEAPTDVDVHF